MNYPKVSIVILNWNGLRDTIECLESLKEVTYPNYEVIVVDNGSEGNDVEVLRQRFGDYIHIIENERNYGFAKGNNIAIHYALKSEKVKYIALLNNDTKVDRYWLEEAMRVAETDERIGICAPKILKMHNPKIIDSTGHVFKGGKIADRGTNEVDRGQFDDKVDIVGAMAAACLYRSEMLQEIGLFDENFITSYEDAELSWRAYRRGWKAKYVPTSIVYHKRGATMKKDKDIASKMALLQIKNEVITVKRYGTQTQKITFISGCIGRGAANLVRRILGQSNIGTRVYIEGFKKIITSK